ncbi:hypothetical protein V2J09_012474 [Rumex salicifolius]
MLSLFPLSPAKLPIRAVKPSLPVQIPSPHISNSVQIPINSDFDRLRSRLIDQSDGSDLRGAISTVDSMLSRGLDPDPTVFSILLKSCVRARRFDLGKLVHARLARSRVDPDSVLVNSLITLYSKCGDWMTAVEIFEAMKEKRDLVSWSAMISCFANNGLELRAVRTFSEMLCSGFSPNEFCFAAVIRACSNEDYAGFGDVVFGMAVKTGYFCDLCVGCALIDMLVKGYGDLGSAKKVFDKMPERNVVTWSLMISRLVQLGFPDDAIELFLEMELSGHEPDRFTLTSVISACVELKLLPFGRQLHSRVIRSGLASDAIVACSLVDMYSKSASHAPHLDSRKVFDSIFDHNVMSWTAVITSYVQSGGQNKEAIELFVDMLNGPVMPNHFTFASVLKACANLEDANTGEQIHGHVAKLGFASDNCVGNAVISMYTHSNRIDEARKAFDALFEKNLVSYNTIVDGYAKNMDSNMAFEILGEIENTQMSPNAFTLTSLLSGAASTGAASKGEVIHARVVKTGFESNTRVCNALIAMYSKCGEIESSYRVFNEMEDRNVVSWTSMITGFAKHGLANRALETFKKMEDAGIEPNEVTYVAVLSACSHVGMVSEGQKHFQSMRNEHGIRPRMEHYACLVDLFGRVGLLSKALETINSMPFKANCLVWRTLLGACQVHGDTEIGELAAKAVLEQDPYDPAAYTLLSNLYAAKDQWEDVAQIRKDMKEKSLRKEAGCSWTEIENQVHKFYVGDTSHIRAEEIYEELNGLIGRIKEMGYVPDTSCVLHDIEDEQKEIYLLQHSEKVAVAFGLISTHTSKPIKIFKNLRVCGDCHTAMKYVSSETGREIVLRDSNRFHHFRNGVCSCNDYW